MLASIALAAVVASSMAAEPPQLPGPEVEIVVAVGKTVRFRFAVQRIAVSGCSTTDFDVRTEGNGTLVLKGIRPTRRCPLHLWRSGGEAVLRFVTVVDR